MSAHPAERKVVNPDAETASQGTMSRKQLLVGAGAFAAAFAAMGGSALAKPDKDGNTLTDEQFYGRDSFAPTREVSLRRDKVMFAVKEAVEAGKLPPELAAEFIQGALEAAKHAEGKKIPVADHTQVAMITLAYNSKWQKNGVWHNPNFREATYINVTIRTLNPDKYPLTYEEVKTVSRNLADGTVETYTLIRFDQCNNLAFLPTKEVRKLPSTCPPGEMYHSQSQPLPCEEGKCITVVHDQLTVSREWYKTYGIQTVRDYAKKKGWFSNNRTLQLFIVDGVDKVNCTEKIEVICVDEKGTTFVPRFQVGGSKWEPINNNRDDYWWTSTGVINTGETLPPGEDGIRHKPDSYRHWERNGHDPVLDLPGAERPARPQARTSDQLKSPLLAPASSNSPIGGKE